MNKNLRKNKVNELRNKSLRHFFTSNQIEIIENAINGKIPKSSTPEQNSEYVIYSRIKSKIKALEDLIKYNELFKLIEK